MKSKFLLPAVAITFGAVLYAQSPMPAGRYMSAAEFAAGLEQTAGDRSGMVASRFFNTDDYRINMIHRTQAAGAIVHDVGTELHYITGGAGTLVTGGVVVRTGNGGPSSIEGGTAQKVSMGDAVLIPEGTPHQYTEVEGSVTYLEVRF